MITTSYDPEAGAVCARFMPGRSVVAETPEVASCVMLDLDAAGQLVGIEILSVKLRGKGVFQPRAAMNAAQ